LFNRDIRSLSYFSAFFANSAVNGKQTQNKAKTNPISETAKTNANLFTAKDYENEPRLPAPGKQTQSNPISKAKKCCKND